MFGFFLNMRNSSLWFFNLFLFLLEALFVVLSAHSCEVGKPALKNSKWELVVENIP